jgi:signal transduction histidine kinase
MKITVEKAVKNKVINNQALAFYAVAKRHLENVERAADLLGKKGYVDILGPGK